MECKRCGRLLDQAMEGELICSSCLPAGQMGDEERLLRAAIAAYRAEQTIRAEQDLVERDEPKGLS